VRLEAHTIFGFLGVKMVEKWLRVFTCGFIAKNIPLYHFPFFLDKLKNIKILNIYIIPQFFCGFSG